MAKNILCLFLQFSKSYLFKCADMHSIAFQALKSDDGEDDNTTIEARKYSVSKLRNESPKGQQLRRAPLHYAYRVMMKKSTLQKRSAETPFLIIHYGIYTPRTSCYSRASEETLTHFAYFTT